LHCDGNDAVDAAGAAADVDCECDVAGWQRPAPHRAERLYIVISMNFPKLIFHVSSDMRVLVLVYASHSLQ